MPVDPGELASPGTTGEKVPGPDGESCVVLDIGADIGALVLYAPPDLVGAEIEISLTQAATQTRQATQRHADHAPRTHALVRERQSGTAEPVYAAVYPGLAAGTYTIWRDTNTPAGATQVEGGQVTSWHWAV